MILSNEQNHFFQTQGYILLENFFDVQKDIAPIQEGIQKTIQLIAQKYKIEVPCAMPEEAMKQGYMALIEKDRKYGSEVYDAVKQIPAFMRLVSKPENQTIFEELRRNETTGLAAAGYGMRIDNPAEEKFRAQWHQEFPGQLRSLDGIVFWSPLIEITLDMGPVQIAPKSHQEGLLKVYEDDKGVGASGAYALHIENIDKILSKYEIIEPLTKPGDLLVMDFLTLHQSGYNVSKHPRWSMQYRYFNFNDPLGKEISWKGSFAAGTNYKDIISPYWGRKGT